MDHCQLIQCGHLICSAEKTAVNGKLSSLKLLLAFGIGIAIASIGWYSWWFYRPVKSSGSTSVHIREKQTNNNPNIHLPFLKNTGTGLLNYAGGPLLKEPNIELPKLHDPPPSVKDDMLETPLPGNIQESLPNFQITELPLDDPSVADEDTEIDLSNSKEESEHIPILKPVYDLPPASNPVTSHPLVP